MYCAHLIVTLHSQMILKDYMILQAIPQMPELNFQEWMQNVGVFEEIMKGFLIGVLASAPMGPVGILTVQRTLNKGRWEGFATGIGASISDILYAIITGYFMFLVVDIIEDPIIALWIKVIGSALLFAFGIYTFRSIPKQKVVDREAPLETKNKLTGFVISGFLITVSNPLIILLFVALFGQFTFILAGNWVAQTMGYLSIVVGALAWWFGLTWLVDKVRARFSHQVIWRLNRVIGIIVMVVSAIMIVYALTGHTFHYIPFGERPSLP